MTTPISSVNGLVSGIQWQSLITQIMQGEQQTQLDPVTAQQTAAQAQNAAWTQFQTVVSTFRDSAAAIADPSLFDELTATDTKSPTSGQELVTATAAAGAAPGTYGVEVLGLAASQKVSGAMVADSSTALGISGQFSLNGIAITVASSDSLSALADKINSADSGTTPSGVSATILSGAAGSRLVLTSDQTGASGIAMVDDGQGTLQALGLTDGTQTANITSSGATQTYMLSSANASVGSLLGLPMPGATSISVGGQSIAVDLSVDSLSTIAAKINAATGNPTAASVQTETVGTQTLYRLVTNGAVETDPAANATDSARALSVLGFTQGGLSGVTQVVQSANGFTDASGGLAASGTTLLTNLQANGQSLGFSVGDTIKIAGTSGNGTSVARTFTIGAGSTMQDLLSAINDSSTGFGAGTRSATASIVNGHINLTDSLAGDSQLGISLTATKANGNTISLGAFSTSNGGTVGRSRQLAAGSDATIRADGQVVTSSSNTVTNAIGGVTLNLLAAEQGTTVNVTVARNTSDITSKIQAFVTAYNAIGSFITTNTVQATTSTSSSTPSTPAGPLANDATIRSMGSSLTNALVGSIPGLTGSYTAASLVGLQHDSNGVLSLNTTTFSAALQTNFNAVKQLFAVTGNPTDSQISFVSAGVAAQPSTTPYAVNITQAATTGAVTGSVWSTYATAGAPDTMSVSDISTGGTGSITLANGDSIDTVVQKLNSMFAAQKMHLTAAKTSDGRLQISTSDYGSAGGFTVGYTPGAGGDGTAALGIAAQSYSGLDVAGTINGAAGTGRGQYLTGASGDASEGIILQYTGTTARSAGTVAVTLGVGGTLDQIASNLAATNTGGVAEEITATQAESDLMASRITDIQARLAAEQATLTQEFVNMETAMAQAQALGSALSAQIGGLQSTSSSQSSSSGQTTGG
jgi:flagellar hook-associated protein 2